MSIKSHKAARKTRTVYVSAHQSQGGAGFDWFYKKADALKAHAEEKANEKKYKNEGWTAYFFTARVSSKLSREQITALIDSNIDERCAKVGPARSKLFPL